MGQKIDQHNVDVWLVNTDWSGGPYDVGQRIAIGHTRAIIRAALSGPLSSVVTKVDPVFGLSMPIRCPDVPNNILNPRYTWADAQAYDRQAKKLAAMFQENFTQFSGLVPKNVVTGEPIG
ncbi:MAG: phosphoenolpyruvate carboxykinase (ATP) [Chloroflexota bacterium]